MRKIHLILLTALIAVFVFFIPSSHAQSDISLVDLNYTDTKNWHCNVPGSGDTTPLTFIAQSDLLAIIVDAEVATGFTNKDIRLDFLGDSVPTDIFNVSKNSFRTKICYTMHPAYASCGDAGVDSSMYDVSRNVNAYDYLAGDQIDVFWRTYFFDGGCDTWGWNSTFTIHSAIAVYDGPPPPPAWIKPVSSLQAGAWGQSQIDILYAELEEGVPDPFPGFPDDVVSDLTVMASSDEDDDYVHAATEGTVIEVRRGTRDDCRNFLKEWRRPVGGFGVCSIMRIPTGGMSQYELWNLPGAGTFNNEMLFDVVTIHATTGELISYMVSGAANYVNEGDLISGGCILGKTFYLTGVNILGQSVSQSPYAVTFAALFDDTDTQLSLIDRLTIDPDPASPCNADDQSFAGCLGEYNLNDSGAWDTTGLWSTDSDSSVLLLQDDYISTVMSLDAARDPEMVIYTNGNQYTMQLGDNEVSRVRDVSSFFSDWQIDSISAGNPDQTSLYTVKVTNNIDFPMLLPWICVRHTKDESGDDIDQPPPGDTGTNCIFDNASFSDESGPGWNLTGTAKRVPGEIRQEYGTISQQITLPAGDYTISARIGLLSDDTYPGSEDFANGITISYDFDGTPGTTLGTASYGQLDYNNDVTVSGELNVAIETTSTIIFSFALDSMPGATGIIWKDLCISQTGEDNWPGRCETVTEPTGDGVGDWTRWHWQNLNQFFTCKLMLMLKDIYTGILDQIKMLGWFFKWLILSVNQGADWLESQLLPWLGGYLANAGGGDVFYESAVQTCEWWNLPCHLTNALNSDLLNNLVTEIFGPIVDFVLYVLIAIFDLLLKMVTALMLMFINMALDIWDIMNLATEYLFQTIYDFTHATPTVLPGTPECTTDTDNGICVFWWMMEHTVFTGPGTYFIPLFNSIIILIFGFYVFIQWRRAVREIASSA